MPKPDAREWWEDTAAEAAARATPIDWGEYLQNLYRHGPALDRLRAEADRRLTSPCPTRTRHGRGGWPFYVK
jgi:hypothetical protein